MVDCQVTHVIGKMHYNNHIKKEIKSKYNAKIHLITKWTDRKLKENLH